MARIGEADEPEVLHGEDSRALDVRWPASPFGGLVVSKKTKKRKLRARRNKANHGKRPNVGRR